MKLEKKETANGLTQSILRFISSHRWYCTRIQSQGQYNAKLKRWTKGTTRKGIGDILAIIRGDAIMIEVKVGKDKQSQWQKQTQKDVEKSFGIYLQIKSFDEFKMWYDYNDPFNHNAYSKNNVL